MEWSGPMRTTWHGGVFFEVKMRIPVEKLSVEFICNHCNRTQLVPVTDLPTIGDPFCDKCNKEMDIGDHAVTEDFIQF